MKKEKIGIFGGTFSPPHLGHAHALEAFLVQEKPDTMLVIPTAIPPHKQLSGDAGPLDRLEMCHLAFDAFGVTVSDMEISRGGKSYTVDTLEALSRDDRTLVLLCGTDMFLSLDAWYMFEKIFQLAEIVYVEREDDEHTKGLLEKKRAYYEANFSAIVRPLLCTPFVASSTMVREAFSTGEDTSLFLNPSVRRYVEECHLYQT